MQILPSSEAPWKRIRKHSAISAISSLGRSTAELGCSFSWLSERLQKTLATICITITSPIESNLRGVPSSESVVVMR